MGVIVLREGRVLLGRRLGSHGKGTWAFPGGHLEFGEDVETCARREVLEETGLTIDAVARGPFTSDVFAGERKHHVTIFVVAFVADGGAREPQLREPDKCAEWRWFPWSALPQPLFAPVQSLVSSGYVP